MLMINGPIKKYVRQICKCIDSHCITKTKFGEVVEVEDDKFNIPIIQKTDVCSVCETPYKVSFDTSNMILIKNIKE